MFQSFTNYLMGSILGVENSSSITLRPEDQGQTSRREGQDNDEEWVLVDADDEADGEEDAYAVEGVYELPPHRSLSRTSSTSSLHSGSVMEESWFITPPPCFTSQGPVLSTSPLENLLIEHPSMSVYHFNSSSEVYVTVSSNASSEGSEDSEDESEEEDESDEEFVQVALLPSSVSFGPPRRQNMGFPGFAVVEDPEVKKRYDTRKAQKLQIKTAQKKFRRGCLVRTNKAREVNSRNHRQRRGERSQGANRSHANNNRKC